MPAAERVEMVCHRGANRVAPENTLASARAAFALGADYVELDAFASADGELVVIHDHTFDRTTNGSGPIDSLTLAEIAELDAGAWFGSTFSGERVPTLDEMLALASGKGGLYIEIKQADGAAVVALTEKHDMLSACFFWSEEPAILTQLAGHSPAVSLMIRHKDYDDLDEAIARFCPTVLEFEPDAVSAAEIARCRQHKIRPMVFYGGDDLDVFHRLADAGIELFNLDQPDAFNAAFRSPS